MEQCLSGFGHLFCLAVALAAVVLKEVLVAEFVQVLGEVVLFTAGLKSLVFLIEQFLELLVLFVECVELVDLLRLTRTHLLRFGHRLFHFSKELFFKFFPGDRWFFFRRRLDRLFVFGQRHRIHAFRYERRACSDPGRCQAGKFRDFTVFARLGLLLAFFTDCAFHLAAGKRHGVLELVLIEPLGTFIADAAVDIIAGDRRAVRTSFRQFAGLSLHSPVSAEHVFPIGFNAAAADAGRLPGVLFVRTRSLEQFLPGVGVGWFQAGALFLSICRCIRTRPERRLAARIAAGGCHRTVSEFVLTEVPVEIHILRLFRCFGLIRENIRIPFDAVADRLKNHALALRLLRRFWRSERGQRCSLRPYGSVSAFRLEHRFIGRNDLFYGCPAITAEFVAFQ